MKKEGDENLQAARTFTSGKTYQVIVLSEVGKSIRINFALYGGKEEFL